MTHPLRRIWNRLHRGAPAKLHRDSQSGLGRVTLFVDEIDYANQVVLVTVDRRVFEYPVEELPSHIWLSLAHQTRFDIQAPFPLDSHTDIVWPPPAKRQ